MKTQKPMPIVAKCWDGAFRKITMVDLTDDTMPVGTNAMIQVRGAILYGVYCSDPAPVFAAL